MHSLTTKKEAEMNMYHETEVACPLCSVAGCNCVDNPDNIIDQDIDQEIDVSEFMQGQRDCKAGIEHKAGQSDSYDRGYATQYELEQIESARTGA